MEAQYSKVESIACEEWVPCKRFPAKQLALKKEFGLPDAAVQKHAKTRFSSQESATPLESANDGASRPAAQIIEC